MWKPHGDSLSLHTISCLLSFSPQVIHTLKAYRLRLEIRISIVIIYA